MYRMRERNRTQVSFTAYAGVCSVILTFVGALVINRLGLPKKWQSAVLGTAIPFFLVAADLRPRWARGSLWLSLASWFAVHLILMWFVFAVILSRIYNFEVFLWVPIAMFETLILYMAVDGTERKLRKRILAGRILNKKS